jgi:hypothetical protein
METVEARLDIEIFVDCPKCGYLIDLMKEEDTNGRNHNEEGHLLDQACPSEGHWSDEHEKFEVKEVTCSECKANFSVKGLEW